MKKTSLKIKIALWLMNQASKKSTKADQIACEIAISNVDLDTIENISSQFKCAEYYRKTGKAYRERKNIEQIRRGKYAATGGKI